jgi:hypothetical protein
MGSIAPYAPVLSGGLRRNADSRIILLSILIKQLMYVSVFVTIVVRGLLSIEANKIPSGGSLK